MRTEQELREELARVIPFTYDTCKERELARAICHLLHWVMGTTNYLPPSEHFGWVSFTLQELKDKINASE